MVNSLVENDNNILKSTLKYESKQSSFTEALFDVLNEDKNKVTLIDADSGRQWSAGQLLDAIVTLAVRFQELGISKGDCVACFCPNSDFHVIAKLTLWSIGAVYAGLYLRSPIRELLNLITKTNATYLIGSKETLSVCSEFLLTNSSQIKKFLLLRNSDRESNETQSVESLLEQEVTDDEERNFFECVSHLKPDDLCKVSFSSGTTGEPKGLSETHRRVLALRSISPPEFDIVNSSDTCALLQPLPHSGGTMSLCVALLNSAKVVVFSRFDCLEFANKVREHSVTFAVIVPSYLNMLNLAFPETIKSLNIKKVVVGGEFAHEWSSKRFIANFKPQYFGQGYGCTEAGGVSIIPFSEGVTNLRSVGILEPDNQVKIVSLITGETMKANEIGEIYMKGPQMMKGYLSDEATSNSFDEENFFKSGDIGYYDENGYLYYVDRIKQIIKYCAQQVSPTELQNILLQHEAVKEAAVIGIDDSICGQLPKAFVALREEFKGNMIENDLLEFVNNQVADYKKLRGGLKFVDDLPKTSFGKIDGKALKNY